MTSPLLHFQCRFQYSRGFALDAAFDLPPGVSALFGPSGSGKSTCLSLIAGLLRPSAGEISLGSKTLVDRAKRIWTPPHRRQLGVVFQDHLLLPHKNIAANLRYGMTRTKSRTIDFDDVVEVLDLREMLTRYPAQLSGGQQRRAALGRALLTEPQLLLMDEPLTGLEESLRDRILDYLQQVHQQWQVPMLLISHDQTAVRRLAQHVVVLENGRVVDQGPTLETLDRATMQTMAGAPGPINLLRIEQVHTAEDHSEGMIGNQRFYLPGKATSDTAYVRCLPRDVALTLDDVPRISMRNHLRGTIRDMIEPPGAQRVFVGVDAGQLLWAELTRSACTELNLTVGMPVVCLIKASATQQII